MLNPNKCPVCENPITKTKTDVVKDIEFKTPYCSWCDLTFCDLEYFVRMIKELNQEQGPT